jgi:hypothetical protein
MVCWILQLCYIRSTTPARWVPLGSSPPPRLPACEDIARPAVPVYLAVAYFSRAGGGLRGIFREADSHRSRVCGADRGEWPTYREGCRELKAARRGTAQHDTWFTGRSERLARSKTLHMWLRCADRGERSLEQRANAGVSTLSDSTAGSVAAWLLLWLPLRAVACASTTGFST